MIIGFADYGMNILSGDNMTSGIHIPKINLGKNIFSQMGSLIFRSQKRTKQFDNSPLSGDILTGGIDWGNLAMPTSQGNFDIPMPKFELPNNATSNNSTSNSSNTFNFGGVNISNGMDFDEFAFRLQQMLSMSSANSESV